ncbi:MAG: hypothetical protein HKN51_00745, partial [Saprospiraceae bacterium]|nr:hypothetical protein [Saprospiraceae bacterium]
MSKFYAIIIILLLFTTSSNAQNPHGLDLNSDCASCHSPEGWTISLDTFHFNHDTFNFKLDGQHLNVDCKTCHTSLIFNEAPSDCISCHLDIHGMSVGNDCVRCHNTNFWLVDNIPQLHEENGFPLVGNHSNLACVDCHISDSNLRFDRIGNDCVNCHLQDFENTVNPDHEAGGFSMDCIECHRLDGTDWSSENIDHSFFPLTKGHDIQDCKRCHLTDNFSDASPLCIDCHLQDFESTTEPNHQNLDFSTDCMQCHTTDPDWRPAEFKEHDNLYFPIYSGEHQGEWDACVDCHKDPNNYASFTCIQCHTDPETTEEHEGVTGFVFEDKACLACHPTGNADNEFDHNQTNFP